MRRWESSGILAIGEGRAGAGQHQTRLLAQLGHPLGAAGHHIQADEVSRPWGWSSGAMSPQGVSFWAKVVLTASKQGTRRRRCLSIWASTPALFFKKRYMAQLVHLVVAG